MKSFAWMGCAAVFCSCVASVGEMGPSSSDSGTANDAGHEVGLDASLAADAGTLPVFDAGTSPTLDAGGPIDAGPPPCPTSPPFDDTNADLVARCTKPIWVAVGGLDRRAVSYDAITWTDTAIAKADVPQGANQDLLAETQVLIRNGIVLVIGGNGLYYSKNGGLTFEEAPNISHPGFELYGPGIGFLNGTFWLNGHGGTWSSTDGKTWVGTLNETPLPGTSTLSTDGKVTSGFDGHGHGVASGNGRIIFTNDSARYRMFDGTRWYESKLGDYGGFATGITYGPKGFMMVGDTCCNIPAPNEGGLRSMSLDGKTWTTVTNDTPGAFQVAAFGSVIWDGTRYFASAGPWVGEAYASTDGSTWAKTPINAAIGTVAIEGDVWAAIAQVNIVRSTDKGATWTRTLNSTGENADNWFNSIAAGRVLK